MYTFFVLSLKIPDYILLSNRMNERWEEVVKYYEKQKVVKKDGHEIKKKVFGGGGGGHWTLVPEDLTRHSHIR